MRAICLAGLGSIFAIVGLPQTSEAGGWCRQTSGNFYGSACQPTFAQALPPAPPGMQWVTVTEMVQVAVQRTRCVNGQLVIETVMEQRPVSRTELRSVTSTVSSVEAQLAAVNLQIQGIVRVLEGVQTAQQNVQTGLGVVQLDGTTLKSDLGEVKKKLDNIIKTIEKKP
jgi:hypothetical protein